VLVRQRVSLITLGVLDLHRARRFYEALGWSTGAAAEDDVVFFQTGEMVLALWDRARLAQDSAVEDSGGWGGVTLALNVGSPEHVRAVIEEARAAGASNRARAGRDVLGRLQRRLHRHRGASLGGRPQPALGTHRRGRRASSLSRVAAAMPCEARRRAGLTTSLRSL